MEDIAFATTVALHQGLAALASGDPAAALGHFDLALSLDPGASTAAFQRALSLSALSRRDEAQRSLSLCLLAQPDNAALRGLSRALVEVLPSGSGEALDPGLPKVESVWRAGDLIDNRWEVFGSSQGGMGRVYFVRDREWKGLELAMKSLSLRPDALAPEARRVRAMFRRETQIWLDLGSHPHIVSGFYTLEVQGALRFFMEYVPGRALDAVLRVAHAGLAPSQVLDLAIQLASGVGFLHARGVVHRDLKPENCLIMEDGTLRVTDFGLGKIAGQSEVPSLVDTHGEGTSLSIPGAGTPWYMAPEQWRSLGEAGAAADVYAFGAILHELLTGQRVFDTTAAAIARYAGHIPGFMRGVLDGERASREVVLWLFHAAVPALGPRSIDPRVTSSLDTLVTDCMAKLPELRPTIGSVALRLHMAFQELTGGRYPRELPGAMDPTESSENNRAVSYYVMGEVPRAEAILTDWLAKDPTALRPWINLRAIALSRASALAPRVALDFETHIAPAHPMAMLHDRHVREFRAKIRPFAPWCEGAVSALLVSDARLALASGDSVVLIDRRSQGCEVERSLTGHRAGVSAVAFSQDGRVLVTASFDRTARLWEAGSGRVLRTLEGHRGPVLCVALDASGRRVATGGGASYDTYGASTAALRLWDASTGRLTGTLKAHQGSVRAVAFSPDGERLATGSSDGVVLLWDASEAQVLYSFEAHGDAVFVGFSADGQRIFGAHRDGAVRVWDARDGTERVVYGSELRGLSCAAYSARADAVVAGYDDGSVRVFSPASAGGPRVIHTEGAQVVAVGFDPSGTSVTTGGRDGVQVWPEALWRGSQREEKAELLVEAPVSARGWIDRTREREALEARLSQGDPRALAELDALRDRTLSWQREPALSQRIHRAARALGAVTGVRDAWTLRTVDLSGTVQSVRFEASGDTSLVGEVRGEGIAVSRWNLRTGAVNPCLEELPEGAMALALSAEGHRALVSTSGGTVILCRGATGKALRRLSESAQRVTAVALSADGERALAGYEDGTVRLWSAAGGEMLKTLRGHKYGVTSAAFSPDGTLAVTGSWDQTARVWQLASGRAAHTLEVESAGVTAAGFSPCGRWIVVCDEQGARVFDAAHGRAHASFHGHTSAVSTFAFTPDGTRVLSGGWDGAMRLWRVCDGEALRTLEGHAFGVTAVAVSADGQQVLSGGADQSLKHWALDWEFSFTEALMDDARGLLSGAQSSEHWPHAVGCHDLDALCDLWRDLARVLKGEARESLRTELLGVAERCASREPEGSLISAEARMALGGLRV